MSCQHACIHRLQTPYPHHPDSSSECRLILFEGPCQRGCANVYCQPTLFLPDIRSRSLNRTKTMFTLACQAYLLTPSMLCVFFVLRINKSMEMHNQPLTNGTLYTNKAVEISPNTNVNQIIKLEPYSWPPDLSRSSYIELDMKNPIFRSQIVNSCAKPWFLENSTKTLKQIGGTYYF